VRADVRVVLAVAGVLWLLALPYEGLWKDTYVDENAIQPAQVSNQIKLHADAKVTMYFDWENVHQADRYLEELERLSTSTIHEYALRPSSKLKTGDPPTSNPPSPYPAYTPPTPPRPPTPM